MFRRIQSTGTDRSESQSPKHRCLRFSLRTFLLLIFLLTFPISWFALVFRDARQQRRVVSQLYHCGARFGYDYQYHEDGTLKTHPEFGGKSSIDHPSAPGWIRRWTGDEPFCRIVDLSVGFPTKEGAWNKPQEVFHDHQVNDDTLLIVAQCSDLRRLSICTSRVSDYGLEPLSQLRKLRRLTLCVSELGDGIVHLHGLTRLESLRLGAPGLSSEAVERLKEALPNTNIELIDPTEFFPPAQQ